MRRFEDVNEWNLREAFQEGADWHGEHSGYGVSETTVIHEAFDRWLEKKMDPDLQHPGPAPHGRPLFMNNILQALIFLRVATLALALGAVLAAGFCSTPAQAQTLDVSATYGRVFNLATGEWTLAAVPAVEFGAGEDSSRFGGFTFSVSWWLDTTRNPRLPEDTVAVSGNACIDCRRYFEQDWTATWTKEWTDRFSTMVTGAIYLLHELGTDKVWMIETRYRIFGRD